jgi:hypothetical protein
MEAPTCRFCGMRHWGSEHVSPKGTTAAAGRVGKAGMVKPGAPMPGPEPPPQTGQLPDQSVLPVPTEKPDRKAYLREYMVRYRAKVAAAKRETQQEKQP